MTYKDTKSRKCRRCGWPEDQPYETVSRHLTSTGVIVYTRCVCGLLQVRSYPHTGRRAGLIARGDCAGVAATTDRVRCRPR
ncbi:MAG TPA: hypothetical protein VH912_19775 [Streptosporangiaceae bacterium]